MPRLPLLLALAAWVAVLPARAQEVYRYESRPLGAAPDSPAETGTAEIAPLGNGLLYRGRSLLPDGSRRSVRIRTDRQGALRLAEEETDGGRTRASVRVEGPTVVYERFAPGGTEGRTHRLPEGSTPACGESLLLLLRSLPLGGGSDREVFLVDFAGHAISGTLGPRGRETVRVPYGEVECYRVELRLRVLFFRPAVLFWVSREPPHFLVRQEGKRSALSPRYLTELVGRP